jgi:hypothetical protein
MSFTSDADYAAPKRPALRPRRYLTHAKTLLQGPDLRGKYRIVGSWYQLRDAKQTHTCFMAPHRCERCSCTPRLSLTVSIRDRENKVFFRIYHPYVPCVSSQVVIFIGRSGTAHDQTDRQPNWIGRLPVWDPFLSSWMRTRRCQTGGRILQQGTYHELGYHSG